MENNTSLQQQLLEAGVHFGHLRKKWNPKMLPYIFAEKKGIHIIDLNKTVEGLQEAAAAMKAIARSGKKVMFVATKKQAKEIVQECAKRVNMPFVTERWLGGMLTNWSTMYQRIQELERLEKLRDSGDINRLTKKEGLLIEREITRLQTRLSGVRSMKRVPDLLFIVDVGREDGAVEEANHLHIPIVALVDTNCNPQNIDYVIPSNDDAIRAIKLLVSKMADAALEGKASRKDEEPEQTAEAQAEAKPKAEKKAKKGKKDKGGDKKGGDAKSCKGADGKGCSGAK